MLKSSIVVALPRKCHIHLSCFCWQLLVVSSSARQHQRSVRGGYYKSSLVASIRLFTLDKCRSAGFDTSENEYVL